jgi:hypothetical protein
VEDIIKRVVGYNINNLCYFSVSQSKGLQIIHNFLTEEEHDTLVGLALEEKKDYVDIKSEKIPSGQKSVFLKFIHYS